MLKHFGHIAFALALLLGAQTVFAATPSYIQVAPDGSGKKVDQNVITFGGNTVYRQTIGIGDPTTGTSVAAVDAFGRLNIGAPNVSFTHAHTNVTTASTSVLAANSSRKYAFIENTTSTPAYLDIGTTAATTTGIYIGPFGSYELSSTLGNLSTAQVNVISTSGTIAFATMEGQ